MVTPEMRASALEAIEEERRREWRASRSPFQRRGFAQTFQLATTAPSDSQIASASGSDLERIKRLQIKLALPKGVVAGWFGTMRIGTGTDIDKNELGFGDPLVLRPIWVLGNAEQTTYWDYYLPAINLTDGDVLYLVGQLTTGATASCLVTLRWVHERGLEG